MKCPLCGSNMHEAFGRMICDNPNCHYMQYRRSKKKQSKKPKQKSIKRKTIKKKVNKMIKKYPKCVGRIECLKQDPLIKK